MKRLVCALLGVLLLFSVLPFSALAAEGSPLLIALAEDAAEPEQKAAETLRQVLAQMLPEEPTVGSDAANADFVIGTLADQPAGSYRVTRQNGGAVTVLGSGAMGAQNGVYAFLRDYCGCRWFAADERVVPQVDALDLPAEIDDKYSPFFEYSYTDWFSSRDTEFRQATGQTGNGCYIYGFCHTLATRFCARDTYFEEHPEYFALRDGKRVSDQLCLTNPDVLRIVTEEVMDVLHSSRYDPDADLQIISITQDDNQNYCECDACKALDEANGSHAGTNLTFANAVADAVKAAGYDNVAIDTFAYEYTRRTPTAVVPRDNVIVRLCSIECCFCHTLDDEKCEKNVEFMRDLSDWGKICDRIYIWDYTNNYYEYQCLYPDFGVLQRNVQIFYENNAKGLFEEGSSSRDMNTEFGELRGYLLARLMQDPYLDYDAEMRDFLNAYYGDGGDAVCRFLLRTVEKAGASYKKALAVFPNSTDILPAFTAEDVAYCDECWQEAKEKTQGTRFYERVERSELSWRFWKCSNFKGEFSRLHSTLYQRMRGRKALYDDLKRHGVTRINDTRPRRTITESMTLVLLRRPGKWCELYEEKYWDAIEPAVLAYYNLCGKIYDKLGIEL
ncbi:MAG: DUF4838 domain-containing protein [Clostridia bacterium]|nr:DUF4838 domain-containing protein [Clostridia bacterium]